MPPALLYEAPACFGVVIKTWRPSCMFGLRVPQHGVRDGIKLIEHSSWSSEN